LSALPLLLAAGDEEGPAGVLMHHILDQPFLGLPSKHLVFFGLAALAVLIVARLLQGIGGALLTNDDDIHRRLKFLQLSEVAVPGIDRCFDDIAHLDLAVRACHFAPVDDRGRAGDRHHQLLSSRQPAGQRCRSGLHRLSPAR